MRSQDLHPNIRVSGPNDWISLPETYNTCYEIYIQADEWEAYTGAIQKADQQCTTFTSLVDNQLEQSRWQELHRIQEKHVQIQKDILEAFQAYAAQQNVLRL